jgi:hypothetical protein
MPHLSRSRRRPAANVALPILLLACGGLTACGGSSSSMSSSPAAANAAAASTAAQATGTTSAAQPTATAPTAQATGTTPTAPAGGPTATGLAAVRECLQKNGVTLPQRPAGGGTGASPTLPKGMTRAQYLEVLKKCGRGFGGARATGVRPALNNQRFRQAVASFAACLRQNGIDVPAPDTSGKGPIFSTKGIDTSSPKFKQAKLKCRASLLSALQAGTAGGAGASTKGAGAG